MVNAVKEKLRRGEAVVGMMVWSNNVETAVLGAQLGFDFLWVEMEHSPVALDTLRQIVLATRGLPAVPFARPPVIELWTAKRFLDMGVLGVIFPFTRTAADAQLAASACRYPPLGLRGCGSDLAASRWPSENGYHDFADENVLVVAVIECVNGVKNIEEIAATPGIDVLFVGTSDLSFSMGFRGRQGEPELEAAVARVADAARRNGKWSGRPAITPSDVERFKAQGHQFLMGPSELGLLTAGAAKYLEPIGKFTPPVPAGGPKGGSAYAGGDSRIEIRI
jgi:2-keto-3-deoxy-L-rhamnonate aldolase RhmA